MGINIYIYMIYIFKNADWSRLRLYCKNEEHYHKEHHNTVAMLSLSNTYYIHLWRSLIKIYQISSQANLFEI